MALDLEPIGAAPAKLDLEPVTGQPKKKRSKEELIQLAQNVATEEGVDPALFHRLVQRESGFNPEAKSPAGALGLAQLMPATAKIEGVDPSDEEQNLRGGARQLKKHLTKFGDVKKALAAYNFGEGNVEKGLPYPQETLDYIKAVAGGSEADHGLDLEPVEQPAGMSRETRLRVLARQGPALEAEQAQIEAENAALPREELRRVAGVPARALGATTQAVMNVAEGKPEPFKLALEQITEPEKETPQMGFSGRVAPGFAEAHPALATAADIGLGIVTDPTQVIPLARGVKAATGALRSPAARAAMEGKAAVRAELAGTSPLTGAFSELAGEQGVAASGARRVLQPLEREGNSVQAVLRDGRSIRVDLPDAQSADLYHAVNQIQESVPHEAEVKSALAKQLGTDEEKATTVAAGYFHDAQNAVGIRTQARELLDEGFQDQSGRMTQLANKPIPSYEEFLRSDTPSARAARAALNKESLADEAAERMGKVAEAGGADDAAKTGMQQEMREARRVDPDVAPEDILEGKAAGGGKPGIELPDPVIEGKLAEGTAREVTSTFAQNIEALEDTVANAKGERIFKQLSEAIMTRGAGKSKGELARLWREAATYSGRILNMHSQLQKILKAQAKNGDQEAAMLLKKVVYPGRFSRAIQLWRGSVTGKVFTGMGNMVSSVAQQGTAMLDEAFGDAVGRIYGITPGQGASRFLKVARDKSLFTPAAKAEFAKLYKDRPEVFNELFDSIEEFGVGKYTRNLPGNVVNRTVENYFRDSYLQAILPARLRQAGLAEDLAHTNPGAIPKNILDDAVFEAREFTMSATHKWALPYQRFAQRWPAMYVLLNAFPRYTANAATWLMKHDPASGLVRFFLPGDSAFGLGTDPAQRARAVGKAMTGATMLATALGLRYSGLAGDKWQELRTKFGDIDLGRNPSQAPFLFLAEAIKQMADGNGLGHFSPTEFAQGVASVNRLGGLGALAAGLWMGEVKDRETFMKRLEEETGKTIAGFARPLSDLRDLNAFIDPEDADIKDFRDSHLSRVVGPTAAELPKLGQGLPTAVNPLTGEKRKREFLALKFLGVKAGTYNAVEDEAVKLGLTTSDVLPTSGFVDSDRATARRLGKMVYGPLAQIVQSPEYKKLDRDHQYARFNDYLSAYRRAAEALGTADLGAGAPRRIIELKIKRLGKEPRSTANLEVKKALQGMLEQMP